jgi:hypothetical protein
VIVAMSAPGAPGAGYSPPKEYKATPHKALSPGGASAYESASDGLSIMGSLLAEQEEKQRLEKTCFDLKMKIYYLEENLKRFQDSESRAETEQGGLKIECARMKLKLEERAVDLEQRNLLLVKSKNAIDALKTELERLRGESDAHADLEERVRGMKHVSTTHTYTYTHRYHRILYIHTHTYLILHTHTHIHTHTHKQTHTHTHTTTTTNTHTKNKHTYLILYTHTHTHTHTHKTTTTNTQTNDLLEGDFKSQVGQLEDQLSLARRTVARSEADRLIPT